MDKDLKDARISVLVHTIAAIVVAYISLQLGTFWYAFPLAIVVLIFIGTLMERVVGKRGYMWWFGNGVIIYLFVWYVSWVVLANIFV